jgi:hypothetical protein
MGGGRMMDEYQVPLVELLKSVPNDARFVQEEGFSSAYYPVGTLCHQAAERISELEKRLDDMAGELMSLENQIGTITGYGHN